MPRVAPRVPEPSDLLCERCGYVLNGLPAAGRCPECGSAVADVDGHQRTATTWERAAGPDRFGAFVRTSWAVIRSPSRFYRTLAVRVPAAAGRSFARLNWWMAGLLFGAAGAAHVVWFWAMQRSMRPPALSAVNALTFVAFTLGLAICTYLVLDGITRVAAGLTHWEGTYRGYRLPYATVLRALQYHSPHYLPVAVVALVTVVGFQVLLAVGAVTLDAAPAYLYVLSGEVVVSAAYLFQTYWLGMKNLLYANR